MTCTRTSASAEVLRSRTEMVTSSPSSGRLRTDTTPPCVTAMASDEGVYSKRASSVVPSLRRR